MTILRKRVHQVFLLICSIFVISLHWLYSPVALFESLDNRRWPFIVVSLSIFYLVRPFVLWPLSFVSVFIGYFVGFPSGVLFVLVGTLVTCLPPFFLANHVHDMNSYISYISTTSESIVTTTGELRGMVAARLSPAPADSVSFSAGLAGVSGWKFMFGTLIGELPWAIFYVTIGQSLRDFSSGSVQPVNVEFLLLVSSLAVFLLARPVYHYIQDG